MQVITDFEIIKKAENRHTKFVFRSDNIVEVYCARDFNYDVADIKENILILNEFAQIQRVKILNMVPDGTSITKAAREFLAEAPHKDYSCAEAFFITSITQQLTGNFYMKINKPKLPTKFFVKFEDAVEWLKSIDK